MINRRSLLLSGAATLLAGCRENPSVEESGKPKVLRLLEPPYAAGWTQAGIPDEGRIGVADAVLSLGLGQPMTGAKFVDWPELALPATGFSIRYEAMRVTGEDFFGTVTFPVPGRDSHVSFVLGGWGGTVTGISSIDFSDANENQTRAEQRFENGQWHGVRIEARPEDLRVWVRERPVVNVSIKGRQTGLRAGFIDHCIPFGFATYGTEGKIRRLEVVAIS
jgi:hypothetical protein